MIFTHGFKEGYFLTGLAVTKENDEKYADLLNNTKTNIIDTVTIAVKLKNHRIEFEKEFYRIRYDFIRQKVEGVFPNSIIFMGTCFGANDAAYSLYDSFIFKGAKAYLGFDEAILCEFCSSTANSFISKLVIDKLTVGDSYSPWRWPGNEKNPPSTFMFPGINDKMHFFNISPESTPVTFVKIPGGTFQMGDDHVNFMENTPPMPVHTVTVSDFEIGAYEITQGQYKAVIGSNPSYFTGDDRLPVEKVNWWDAIKYCNTLSTKAGLHPCYNESSGVCDFSKNGFRLPTEAEWEYACKAGSTTIFDLKNFLSDIPLLGWYESNSSLKTHPVGQKTPNAFGIYDMHGNVWEWCNDWYESYTSDSQSNPTGPSTGEAKVPRGGSWENYAITCRPALRGWTYPWSRYNFIGFRIVRRP